MPDSASPAVERGTPSTSPAGSGRTAPRDHTAASPVAGDTSSSKPSRVGEVDHLRPTGEERVGTGVDALSGEFDGLDGPAEAILGLEQRDVGVFDEIERGGETGDAAADDGDVRSRGSLTADEVGEQRAERGIVVERARAGELDADFAQRAPAASMSRSYAISRCSDVKPAGHTTTAVVPIRLPPRE